MASRVQGSRKTKFGFVATGGGEACGLACSFMGMQRVRGGSDLSLRVIQWRAHNSVSQSNSGRETEKERSRRGQERNGERERERASEGEGEGEERKRERERGNLAERSNCLLSRSKQISLDISAKRGSSGKAEDPLCSL